MIEQRFNLLYEPCIPVIGKGRVSLCGVFEDSSLQALSGTPLQKIALMKLLLAIAQMAVTPRNLAEWQALGTDGLVLKCLAYLKAHEDCFWLYGPRPFLQMPVCSKAKAKAYGTVMPEVASGNTTVLTHGQLEPFLDDADKFLLLLVQMSLCFGGKKPDAKLVLSPEYEKKPSANPGPGICHSGLLHSFFQGERIVDTLYFNLLTQEDIAGQKQWSAGLGIPPWEKMPEGEDCSVAQDLKASLMGRLVPMARFCLLANDGLKFTEGIVHPDYSVGMVDPSVAVDFSGSKPRALWTDPEKRPWRQLPALLSFLDTGQSSGFYCFGLQKSIEKAIEIKASKADDFFRIWSGGVKITKNIGEQYLTGRDDIVESEVIISFSSLGELWFTEFSGSMERLEKLASLLYRAVNRYHVSLKEDGKAYAAEASSLFWQMAERTLQELIVASDHCSEDWTEDSIPALLRRYSAMAVAIYDEVCPHDTARQFEIWVRNRPFSGRKNGKTI
ncbi:MAG: type I-E CRISPR-associated protein Cse1/CasA [Desulfovibrio sp.]|nr:type I-E CRISPR-associated protein Cse1/CasA [Desulfovibrio sp.]